MRMFIVLLLFVGAVATQVIAAPENIGNFDIEKVRAAALGNDTGLAPSAVPAVQEHESLVKVATRITLYLAFVVALILGGAFLFRRNALKSLRGGSGAMDVVETLPLGQNRMLVMVRVMDEIYLLSHTAASIALIEKIGGQKALDIIASSRGGGTMVQFKEVFNSFIGKMKRPS